MIGLIMVSGVLLALIILIKTCGSRWLGSNTEEKITIVFYGFKKRLASGITTAKILFLGHAPGAVVLPLMIFQQIQRMVCAMLAQRYSLCPLSPAITPKTGHLAGVKAHWLAVGRQCLPDKLTRERLNLSYSSS